MSKEPFVFCVDNNDEEVADAISSCGTELVAMVSVMTGVSKSKVKAIFKSVSEVVRSIVLEGGRARVPYIGTFKPRRTTPRKIVLPNGKHYSSSSKIVVCLIPSAYIYPNKRGGSVLRASTSKPEENKE